MRLTREICVTEHLMAHTHMHRCYVPTHQDGIKEGNGVWTLVLCVPSEPVDHLRHQRTEQLLSYLQWKQAFASRRVATYCGHQWEYAPANGSTLANSPSPHHRPAEAQMEILSDTTLSSGSTRQRQTRDY